ncbi:MAG: DNA recombination protein RmuC [Saprospiraceae bacterium]|nr:DNA recombination protein RmuC [Saprospiraceae bacterium]
MEDLQIFILLGLALLLVIYFLYKGQIRLEKQKSALLGDQLESLKVELQQERYLLKEERLEKQRLLQKIAGMESDFRNLLQKHNEANDNKKELEERFELLANKILEKKTDTFDKQHRASIKEILEPLKERIKHFENKVETSNKESIARHSSLREHIMVLTQLNEKVTREASNLTNALKADTKKQGNWGELILESILDKSGLEKGREYHVQKSLHSDEGKRYQPDIVIDLPDGKKMIIDSKVSLVAYEQFINADKQDDQDSSLKAHVMSIKKHIDGLAEKKYHELYKIESPDFVLMFIPIDTAFSCAVNASPQLYQYAFEKNIVIVTPSTLLATLKTVDTMWQNDKQNRYALEIASEAGKMYDKFTGFVIDLEKIGRQLDTVKTTYDESVKKMSSGTGNLIKRAEKLKQLGAKASKSLPKRLVS